MRAQDTMRAAKHAKGLFEISCYSLCRRLIYSQTKSWPTSYKKKTRVDVETFWRKKLTKRWDDIKKTPESNKKSKFYCLSMFPYPSGKLHMGHVRVYTISDAMAHFYRMNGKNVIHPMGWDAFGLPAENAALERGLDPSEWTQKNIAYMKDQLRKLNLFFDWEREFSTCDPDYYRWTQYLFLKLFKAGLAYRSKAAVNWDPVDKTVLAEEQVDEEGKSWRSGATVEKRVLEQWFLAASRYSSSLLQTLNQIDERFGIKGMQKSWIGKISGSYVKFSIEVNGKEAEDRIPVFCTHPEILSSATHLNILPRKVPELAQFFNNQEADASHSKLVEGDVVPLIRAVNPFTGEKIPLIISDHHGKYHNKAPAILGIPKVNDIDKQIANDHGLDLKMVKETLTREEALAKIVALGRGSGVMTSSHLQDWLISRQRRWGTPIPIVYCPQHGAVPVPKDRLPVVLPKHNESLDDWKRTTCPECGSAATRETDTMDTFVDSSWYFFRFTDPHNDKEPFSKESAASLMPVDLYIGGKEHATLHLYYARFISQFCSDQGMVPYREPFKKLLAQGIIKGKTFRLKSSGKYLRPDEVKQVGDSWVESRSDEEVEMSFEKMSKSKMNGVDPEDFVAEWGITLTRLFVLYAAAPFESIHWDVKTDVIPGMMRWQMKLWNCVTMLVDARKEERDERIDHKEEKKLSNFTNATIRRVTREFEESLTLSAAITKLMTLAKQTSNSPKSLIRCSAEYERSICAQVVMATPLMPHFTSELWEGLRSMEYKLTEQAWDETVLDQPWPKQVHLKEKRLPEPENRVETG